MSDTYTSAPAEETSPGLPSAGADQLLKKVLKGKEQKQLIEQFEGYYNKCRQARLRFERQWYTNIAFYFGRQYVQWTGSPGNSLARLQEPAAPPWRIRLVSNKIKPVIRGELAKLISEKPQPFVIPTSTEEEDRIAAQAAENIFEHEVREIGFNKSLRRTAFWALMCGSSFMKDWYEPYKVTKSGQLGSTQAEAVTAFHLFAPDLQEEEIENQPYLIHAMTKDLNWVRLKYGDLAKAVQSNGTGTGDNAGIQTKFLSALGINNTTNKGDVLVKEIWIKPGMHAKFPNGLLCAWAGDIILNLMERWPLPFYEYPFSKLDHIPTGRFYGQSVIEDLIPLQKEYNRTRSQIIESKNRMSKPQLVAPKGAVEVNKITSAPGLVIEYKPGFLPPTPLQLQDLPSYVVQEQDRIQADIDDISSQHEVSRGRTPPNVEAAVAISYLQEADNSRLATTISSLEELVEKVGQHMLSYAGYYWMLPRQIKTLNTDGAYEAQLLRGSDLRGNTDLHVVAGSAAPRSKAAKQAWLLELLDRQVVPPVKIMRYLDLSEVGKLYEEIQVDARQADRENLRMAQGSPVQPNDFDNHEIHVEQHNTFRKKQAYEMLPDEVKQIFQQHVMLHQQLLSMAMGQIQPPGQPSAPTRSEDVSVQRHVDSTTGSSSPGQAERQGGGSGV